MDSLSTMIGRLRINDKDFKERLIDITSVYSAPFDSDTILEYLCDGVLKEDDSDWVVEIPPIKYNISSNEYIIPRTVLLNTDLGVVEIKMPSTIDDFRAISSAFGLKVSLNSKTAQRLYA